MREVFRRFFARIYAAFQKFSHQFQITDPTPLAHRANKGREKPLQKLYATPMTSAQEFGWEKPLLKQKRFPKKSCAETMYADAMYKAGVYF